MFYVMSSHKILEAEGTRLSRGRKSAEKQIWTAQQMKQENNDLTHSVTQSLTSDVNLSHVDQTMPSGIRKDCENESPLKNNHDSNNIVYDKETNDFQRDLTPQCSCAGYNLSENSEGSQSRVADLIFC